MECAGLGHRVFRLARRWEWVQTFGGECVESGSSDLAALLRGVTHDSQGQDLHWCHEHRVDSQLHETGDGLVVAYFNREQETAAVQRMVWHMPP